MSKRGQKRYVQREHARKQAYVRFGVDLTEDEVKQLTYRIRQGKTRCLQPAGRRNVKSVHQVWLQGQMVRVVYDTRRSVIVTFLPQNGWDVKDGEAFKKAYREKHGHAPFDDTKPYDGVDRIGHLPSGRNRRRRAGYLPADYRDPTVDKSSEEHELFREPVDTTPAAGDTDNGTADAPAASAITIQQGEQMQAQAQANSLFTPAERTKVLLRMALDGPSGAGKTYTGLLYARAVAGMDGRIAVVDSENRRSAYYASNDEFRGNDGTTFSIAPIEPPYTIDKWLRAIKSAEDAGFSVLLLDSISQAWQGKGGLLEQKEEADGRPGANHYANWAPITKQHQAFIAAMLNSKVHLIVTMRSRQDYAMTTQNGKTKVEKLGMAPVQREGMEYEFAVVLDMAMDHSAKVSKDITRIYNDKPEGVFKPVAADAMLLAEWLTGGVDGAPVNAIPDAEPAPAPVNGPAKGGNVSTPKPVNNGGDRATPEQRQELGRLCGKLKVNVSAEVAKRAGKGWKLPLTQAQTAELIGELQVSEGTANPGGEGA